MMDLNDLVHRKGIEAVVSAMTLHRISADSLKISLKCLTFFEYLPSIGETAFSCSSFMIF